MEAKIIPFRSVNPLRIRSCTSTDGSELIYEGYWLERTRDGVESLAFANVLVRQDCVSMESMRPHVVSTDALSEKHADKLRDLDNSLWENPPADDEGIPLEVKEFLFKVAVEDFNCRAPTSPVVSRRSTLG